MDGRVAGDGVVRAGGVQLLQGAVLPGVDVGLGGQGLGALRLGGHVLVHGEHLADAVAVKIRDGHFAVGAQQRLGDVPVPVEVGGHGGGAAGGARGAAPADEHVLGAVAVYVPKGDQVHLGGGVDKGGRRAPALLVFFQKGDPHAAPLGGDKAHRVGDAVAGPVLHDDGRAVLPPLGVDEGQLLAVPLLEALSVKGFHGLLLSRRRYTCTQYSTFPEKNHHKTVNPLGR